MFILRRIIETGGKECNTVIGNHYSLILKSRSQEEFDMAQKVFGIHEETILGFISGTNGDLIALYCGSDYFVMTDTGRTFERINFQRG